MAVQQKLPFLIASGFLFILISVIGFGSAVVYSMARLQSLVPDLYVQSIAVSNAGSDAGTMLSRLHNRMLEFVLAGDPSGIERRRMEMQVLDENLRRDFSIVKAEFGGDSEKIAEIERLLDDWRNGRTRLIGLVQRGHRGKTLKPALEENAGIYGRLEMDLDSMAAANRRRIETMAGEAESKSSEIIRMVWWFLGGLAAFNILAGGMAIRRMGTMIEADKQGAKRLHENEERLKLALSGADEGTWDLDIPTGRLNFDSQWGNILGYESENERPHSFDEWAALIHVEDRDRVLRAMYDHVEGWASEYKAEYRIRSRSGTMKWVVGHGRAVRLDQQGKALRVVGVTRDVTQKKQAEDRIWRLAHYDFLTGLPNRPLFYDQLRQSIAQAKRYNGKLALLFLDLDGFKQVNDRFGHDTGDGLLQEVARRLRHYIRGGDIVARTGGDEFIFILNVSHAGDAAIVASKIIHALVEPFVIYGNTCLIGGSIGISLFPDDSNDLETLVKQSDDAMYRAKESGKNNYQFFTAAPSDSSTSSPE